MHLPVPSSTARNAARVAPWLVERQSRLGAAGFGLPWFNEAVRAQAVRRLVCRMDQIFFSLGRPSECWGAGGDRLTDVEGMFLRPELHVANADRYIESILTGTVRAHARACCSNGCCRRWRPLLHRRLSNRFRAPTGQLVVPMPAIIGSGARRG